MQDKGLQPAPSGSTIVEVGKYLYVAGPNDVGQRLDHFLSRQLVFSNSSRSLLQNLVRHKKVLVNGLERKTGYRLHLDDEIEVNVPQPVPVSIEPQDVPFTIIHEDDLLAVLSKPPGIVVHPAAGHQNGTLVHGLLYRLENLSGINGEERPGVVHRLDKDTSGIMVVAKNDYSHRFLVEQFKQRKVEKVYHAILDGVPETEEGRIDQPIGRHPVHRKKMAIQLNTGRSAVTLWKVLEELPHRFCFARIKLETGRTHQIRVHTAAKGFPVAGDPVYGKKNHLYSELEITRQCLHASRLTFMHPGNNKTVSFEAPLYPDMVKVLARLQDSGK